MAEVTTPIITDDTGQDIKDSIDALATALTTDKANRDASNVTAQQMCKVVLMS